MKPLLKFVFAAELFALLIVLARCSSPNVKSTSNVDQEKTMTYFKSMLEESPFNLHFEMPTERWGRADDTTFFTQGHNADRSIEATIRYNPNDGEFYSVDLQLKKLPLDPTQSDVQVLLDFTNKIDPLFANYFWRNKEGIFIDENKFVDWILSSK